MNKLDYRVTFDDGLKADVMAYTAARKKVTHACLGRLLNLDQGEKKEIPDVHTIEELLDFLFEPVTASFYTEDFDDKIATKAKEMDLAEICLKRNYNLLKVRKQEDFEKTVKEHFLSYLREKLDGYEQQKGKREPFEDYMVRNFGNLGWKKASES